MTVKELVEKVAEKCKVTKKDAELIIRTTIDEISNCIIKKDSITFQGFCTFSTSNRKSREARNPKTGAKIKVPAKTVGKAKISKALNEQIK